MKVYNRIKISIKLLKIENERYLAYIYGTKIDKSERLKNSLPRFKGVFLRTLIFFRFVLRKIKFCPVNLFKTDVLFYSGSLNQLNSLAPTITSLNKKNIRIVLLYEDHLCVDGLYPAFNSKYIEFSLADIIACAILFVLRAPVLYWSFRKNKENIKISKYFNIFCEPYIYTVYFLRVLKEANPKFIFVANDHTVPNRTLRLVAEELGIKTAYMQHASVSPTFPALDFDYAFLDGEVALNSYSLAEKNRFEKKTHQPLKCSVFLSGQKKSIVNNKIKPINRELNTEKKIIFGLGVNALDDIDVVSKYIDFFIKKKIPCIIRTHPAQSTIFTEKLSELLKEQNLIIWLSANNNSLDVFFASIDVLLAGNTSLHLEAALAGVVTFYTEFSNSVNIPDYYGFVKNGILSKLPSDFLSYNLEDIKRLAISNLDRDVALRRYSATYKTKWEGLEGNLVALTLICLLKNKDFFSIYSKHEADSTFMPVYDINDSDL